MLASPGKPSMVADRKSLPVFIVKRDCIEEGEREALLLWLMRQPQISLKGRMDVLIREAVAIILLLGNTGTYYGRGESSAIYKLAQFWKP